MQFIPSLFFHATGLSRYGNETDIRVCVKCFFSIISVTSDTSSLPMHSLCMIIAVVLASFDLRGEPTVRSIFR